MKSIIIYYSYTGNTKNIAQKIKDKKDYDILELKPLIPYTDDYQSLVDEEERKMDSDEIIEIKPIDIDLNNYDRIILGTPVWWYSITPVIKSFLKQNNLKKKTIVPFITNGGWLGHAKEDIEKYAKGAKVENFINIKFSENKLSSSKEELDNWINNL